MSESPTTMDNFSEDEAATLILVDVNDSALGSVSLTERLLIEKNSNEQLIHRTCSLHVFWNDDLTGKGSSTSRILLSRALPQSAIGEEFCTSSDVSFTFEFNCLVASYFRANCTTLTRSDQVKFNFVSHFRTIAFVVVG